MLYVEEENKDVVDVSYNLDCNAKCKGNRE